MTEAFWANSHLSVARHYGRVRFQGVEYIIVNKDGKDIFQCAAEAKRAGRTNAIESGEPADLLDKRFLSYYRKLGRDRFIEILQQSLHDSDTAMLALFKTAVKDLNNDSPK